MTKEKMASYIDHTVLKSAATEEDVKNLCSEAALYKFASVCVNPCYVSLSRKLLKGTEVEVCAVVGFPLGSNTSEIKAAETALCVKEGAHEIDMVINVGKMKEGNTNYIENDIKAVVKASGDACVKVIIECCYLNDREKKTACLCAKKAGANFVKTSTGFGPSGATAEDVTLMKKTVPSLKVKAAGGIRTLADAEKMIEAGADRLGASAGISILSEMN